jgi:hypothetical protein
MKIDGRCHCRETAAIQGIASSVLRNWSGSIWQLANSSQPSAVNLCVLVNKLRMISER